MKKLCMVISLLLLSSILMAQRHTYVRFVSADKFSPQAQAILQEALPLIDSVINTPAFRQGILNAKFVNKKSLSNADILRLFLTGKEVHNGKANDTMDLVLETYPDQDGDNIGTTYGSRRIVSSEAYMIRNGARCYAAHLIHEYCHTIGEGKKRIRTQTCVTAFETEEG